MSSAPRIAVFLPDLRPGGAERLHVQLAHEWRALGVAADFVLRQRQGELLKDLPEETRVVDLAAQRLRHATAPLHRYLLRERPQALLAAMWPLTFIGPIAARLAGFSGRVAISEHSPLARAYAHESRWHRLALRTTTRLGYGLADIRIGVSSGVADEMARLSGLARRKFTVIHNPAATAQSGKRQERPELLDGINGPVILSVGTLKPVKRHDLLIDAFARLAAGSNAVLCILGEGGERERLETQVESLGLRGRVLLPGFIADTAPWYASASLFVLASDYEGFGNVLVEAMEHGLPIVSTDCPVGPREVLRNGEHGLLVPTDDPVSLADAMGHVLARPQPADFQRLRAADFAAPIIARRYLDVLLATGPSGITP